MEAIHLNLASIHQSLKGEFIVVNTIKKKNTILVRTAQRVSCLAKVCVLSVLLLCSVLL